jgi:hypothetical protein
MIILPGFTIETMFSDFIFNSLPIITLVWNVSTWRTIAEVFKTEFNPTHGHYALQRSDKWIQPLAERIPKVLTYSKEPERANGVTAKNMRQQMELYSYINMLYASHISNLWLLNENIFTPVVPWPRTTTWGCVITAFWRVAIFIHSKLSENNKQNCNKLTKCLQFFLKHFLKTATNLCQSDMCSVIPAAPFGSQGKWF